MSVFGSDRERRAANNQSLFRAGNERLKQFNEDWFGVVLPSGGWVCEFANDTCLEHIEMASSEYEAVRQEGARFFVVRATSTSGPTSSVRSSAITVTGSWRRRPHARHRHPRRPALEGRTAVLAHVGALPTRSLR
jgi:hypothetical protein